MTRSQGQDAIGRYLDALFAAARPGALIEVRWRLSVGMGQRFIPVSRRRSASGLIAELAAQSDVYVGVLPRWKHAGGRAAIVGDCRTVWVDLDSDVAHRALGPVEPAPSLIVASGANGHLHAYWSLSRAEPPAVIVRANRRLAWALGGDLASTDSARILRLPGTVNHARGGVPVTIIDSIQLGGACRLHELVGGLPDPPGRGAGGRLSLRARTARPNGDWLLDVPPARYVAALTGRQAGRSRKVRCPLHDDRTPSLHVYDDPARGWYCFGCRRGGSVYDLAGALWGIEPRGAGMLALQARLRAQLTP